MTQDGGQGLDVHAVLQGVGGKGVPQVMEPHLLTVGVFQQEV